MQLFLSNYRKLKSPWVLVIQFVLLFSYHIIFSMKFLDYMGDHDYHLYFALYGFTVAILYLLIQISFKNFEKMRVVFSLFFLMVYFIFTIATAKHMEHFSDMIRLGAYKNLGELLSVGPGLVYLFDKPYYVFSGLLAFLLLGLIPFVSSWRKEINKRVVFYGGAIIIANVVIFLKVVSQVNVHKALAAVDPDGPYLTMFEIDDLYLNPAKYAATQGFVTTYVALYLAGKSLAELDQGTFKEVEKFSNLLDEGKGKTSSSSTKGISQQPPLTSARAKVKPNFIFIQFESLDKWAMEYRLNGKLITPFLSRLRKRSMYFENFYSVHSSGGSSDPERASLCSLLPHPSKRHNVKKGSCSVVDILKENGYQTASFHANEIDDLDRNQLHDSLGIEDKYFGKNAFSGKGVGTMQALDRPFYKQSFEYLKKLDKKTPFFFYFITMQSHSPFRIYDTKTLRSFMGDRYDGERLKLGKTTAVRTTTSSRELSGENPNQEKGQVVVTLNREDKMRLDYIVSIHEADQALESFFRGLSKGGFLENTFVIIYADHISKVFPLNQCHGECIPFLIYHKDLPAVHLRNMGDNFLSEEKMSVEEVVSLREDFLGEIPRNKENLRWLEELGFRVGTYLKVSSHLDIAPTLTYILGLEGREFWLGSPLTSPQTRWLVSENGGWDSQLVNGKKGEGVQGSMVDRSQWESTHKSLIGSISLKVRMANGSRIDMDGSQLSSLLEAQTFGRRDGKNSSEWSSLSSKHQVRGGMDMVSRGLFYERGVALGYRGSLLINSKEDIFRVDTRKIILLDYYKHSLSYFEPFK